MIMENTLEKILKDFKGEQSELIPILHAVQEEFTYLSEEALQKVARFTHVPGSYVYAVATFYAHFAFRPRGRTHVLVCRGTTCHVKGAPELIGKIEGHIGIKEGETAGDQEYSLETVACIGTCGMAPCVMIDDDIEANVTHKKVPGLFNRNT
jgi:NADH-quinone oxidoreductase subunit E